MKNLVFVLALLICLNLVAQDDDGYVMYQTIELTPKSGKVQQLMEGLKAHNEKFHTEGDQAAQTWQLNSGPNSGGISWVMGPLTWSTFDKEMTDDHLADWMQNVGDNADMGEWAYWRLADGMAYTPEDFSSKVMRIRYFEINERKADNAREIFSKILEVYRKEKLNIGLYVFSNQAEYGTGRDWAILWQYESWSAMDDDNDFVAKFEAMHGDGSWDEFFENWNEATNWKGTVLQARVPE